MLPNEIEGAGEHQDFTLMVEWDFTSLSVKQIISAQ